MSPAGLALRVGAVPPSPRQVRAKDGDRQRGRGRLSLVCKPRDTVSDNPEYRGTVNDNLTATALLALPVGTRPCQVPACRWPARQDSRREGCSRRAVSRLAFTRCVPAASAPAFSGAASPSRGARRAAHGPRGSKLAFPGSALGWHCGLVRIPWRRQYSPLCRCELGIHGTGHPGTGHPGTGEGTEGAGSGVTPAPAPLAGLCTGKGEEIGCVQMVSVKRSQFLLSPPLSPVTSSVISVLARSGGSHTSLRPWHACPGSFGGNQIQPTLGGPSWVQTGLFRGWKVGLYGTSIQAVGAGVVWRLGTHSW